MKLCVSRFITLALFAVLTLSSLSACSDNEIGASQGGEQPDLVAVTIEVDGHRIIIENAAGRTVLQLLERAKIQLNEGDVVSVPPQQVPEADTTIRILRNPNAVVPDEPDDPGTDTPVNPDREVVSIEYYYDCDGSGHGLKVIIYSDGTREEIPF